MQFNNLKIKEINIYPVAIKLTEPFKIATLISDKSEMLLIHIKTNDDLDGWGEAYPHRAITGETQKTAMAAACELAPLFLGRNPLEIKVFSLEMDRFMPHHTATKSGFDMALHDIAAKASGLPLYRYLGGNRRPIETDCTLGIGDPEMAGEKATEFVQQGYRILKVKVGVGFEADYTRLKNIREAIGYGPKLRIDANQGWDRFTAEKALKAFAQFSVEYCEQPLQAWDLNGARKIGGKSPIPIVADESLFSPSDAMKIVEAEAALMLNIKISKSGGICNANKIVAIGEAAGLPLMLGTMGETRLGLSAFVHFALANPSIRFFDLDSYVTHVEDPIINGVKINNGMLEFDESPGIGAYPDPTFLKKIKKITIL